MSSLRGAPPLHTEEMKVACLLKNFVSQPLRIGHRSRPTLHKSDKMAHVTIILCLYVIVRIYLKQLRQENLPMLWQGFKQEWGQSAYTISPKKHARIVRKRPCHIVNECITLLLAGQTIEMLLIMSGDVELNPGPLQDKLGPDDLSEVFRSVYEVRNKWYSIGVEMRIPTSTLDAIKLEHNDTPDKCLLHMLQHWLSQLSPPSFRDMIRVLSSEPIGEECLASTLERQVYGHSTANDERLTGINLADVRSAVYSIRHKWFTMGVHLGITNSTLHSISMKCHHDPDLCLLEMLKVWLSQNEPLPTWHNLIHILNNSSIAESGLAEKIGKKYCSASLPCQTTPRLSLEGDTIYTRNESSIISKYTLYLKQMYSRFRLPLDSQWPPVRSENYVPISLIVQYTRSVGSSSADKNSIDLSEIFVSSDHNCQIKTVLMEGAPGIGKTATALTICKEWTSGNSFQDFNILLFWSLKDPTLHSLTCLDSLFVHDSHEVTQSVASIVKKVGGKGILFVLDGWDELSPHVSRARNHFLFDIIQGKKLPFSSVVVTTRPIESQYLLQRSMFDRTIEICGFSGASIIQYIEHCFISTPQEGTKLISVIEDRPDIESICYVPMNCAIVSYVYFQLSKLPTTFTQFYSYLTLNSLLRNMQLRGTDRDIMRLQNVSELPEEAGKLYMALCELAFRGLIAGRHSYSREEITKVCRSSPEIITNIDNLGILQAVNIFQVTGMEPSFYFLHSTVRDFMAAKYLSALDKENQKYYLQHYFNFMAFQMVWQFYCGISAEQHTLFDSGIVSIFQEKIKEISWWDSEEYSTVSNSSASDKPKSNVDRSDPMPTSASPSQLPVDQYPLLHDEQPIMIPHGKPPVPSFLSLIRPELSSQAPDFNSKPSTLLSFSKPSVSSVEMIGDVVGSREPLDLGLLAGISPTMTNVSSELAFVAPPEKIEKAELLIILKCIYESQNSSLCSQIAASCHSNLLFRFSLNAEDTNALGFLISKGSSKCWKLHFIGCGLGAREIKTMKHQILSCRNPGKIQVFSLSGNPLDSASVQQIVEMSRILKHLEVLTLSSSQLNDSATQLVSQLLLHTPSLKAINLSDNKITDEGMCGLCKSLVRCAHLSEVNLSHNLFTKTSMKSLIPVIETNRTLHTIKLLGNYVGNKGTETLLSCMRENHPLRYLDLSDNNITTEGAALIATSLCSQLTTLETLVLHSNPIGTAGADLIFAALQTNSSLRRLAICDCDITFNSELQNTMKSSLSQAINLQELELAYNYLGDEGISTILEVIQTTALNIEHLSIACNNITSSILLQLGPILIESNLSRVSLAANELNVHTDDFSKFFQFLQWSKEFRRLDVYDTGNEEEELQHIFERMNSERNESGLREIFVEYYDENTT